MPKEKFVMPKWQDCSWKRKACNKEACKICGPILRDRKERVARGQDPDSIEAALDFTKKTFEELGKMIRKQAKEMGIDLENLEETEVEEPPEAEEFPLYREVHNWMMEVHLIAEAAYEMKEFQKPKYKEALEDLTWYSRTLSAKVYRQLCNRWELEHGDEYADADFEYTGDVLRTCIQILRDALVNLDRAKVDPKPTFMALFGKLVDLRWKIIALNTWPPPKPNQS